MTNYQKRHYEEIANILHNFVPVKSDLETEEGYAIRRNQFEQLYTTFAHHFAIDNSNFDSDRFQLAVYSQES